MARPKIKNLPDLSGLACAGQRITVHVTPNAASERLIQQDGELRAAVTAAPENGKANAAVRKMLAKAMGVAPTNLTLLRGHTARIKIFTYSGSGVSRN